MKVLGLDCSTDLCSVALADGASVVERCVRRPGEQLRLLFPMVLALLSEAGVAPRALDRIAVTVGPASFTGIRLGLTTARTMGQVLERPLVAVSTLDAIAWSMAAHVPAARRLCVMTDARKGQIFASCYELASDSRVFIPRGDARVLDPADARDWLAHTADFDTAVGGSALAVYGELLRSVSFTEVPADVAVPRAAFVARGGRGDFGPVSPQHYETVVPRYLRPPDVKKPRLPPPHPSVAAEG